MRWSQRVKRSPGREDRVSDIREKADSKKQTRKLDIKHLRRKLPIVFPFLTGLTEGDADVCLMVLHFLLRLRLP